MKNFIAILTFSLVLFSCVEEPEFIGYTLQISTKYDTIPVGMDLANTKFDLTNLDKNYTLSATTDANGQLRFNNLESGFYGVRGVKTHSIGPKYYYFNGLLEINVFDNMEDTVHMKMSEGSPLVIKEFYYSGSLTPAGKAYFGDQYIEIYNNSPVLQYADGFSIIEHESIGIENNYWDFVKDSIVVKFIWTIPGSGQDVPLQPGESVLIARTAINHKSDSLGNPNSPVDLGIADFEFFVLREPQKDLDVPTVPNMEEDFYVYRAIDVTFHIRGGSAIALAKLPCNNQQERLDYIDQHLIAKSGTAGSKEKYFAKIANTLIYDAVEVTWDEAHVIYKRMPADLDAGYTFVEAGSKSGLCVRRKIEEIRDGIIVYKDTNNSTEDFERDVIPAPKTFPASH